MTHTIYNPDRDFGPFGKEVGCENAVNTLYIGTCQVVICPLYLLYLLIGLMPLSGSGTTAMLYELHRKMPGTKGHSFRKA